MHTLKLYVYLILVICGITTGYSQNVNIPDANFKAVLLDDTEINTTDDGEISITEAQAFTGTVDVSAQSIADLTGIEAFVNIEGLYCFDNDLTNLDVSANTALTDLRANNNNLTAIDLSNNPLLEFIFIYNNELVSIDLTSNTNLKYLYLKNTGLTSIDLSGNSNLEILDLDNNDLTSIDLGNLTLLELVYLRNNNITTIDLTSNEDLTIAYLSNNSLTSLDVSNNELLIDLRVSNNAISSLDLTSNADLRVLEAINSQLTSLNLTNNTALTDLTLTENQVTTIDLSNQPLLENILMDFNSLSTIDLSNNPLIEKVDLGTNELTSITIGSSTVLHELTLDNNQLSTIDVSANEGLQTVTLKGNQLVSIDVSDKDELTFLDIQDNLIETATIANNPLLNVLYLDDNLLTALDLSTCESITELTLDNNNLTSFNLSNNTQLQVLSMEGNEVETIDLSNNVLLEEVNISRNLLASIDVSSNTLISQLQLFFNHLTELDLSQNTALELLLLNDNDLIKLDLRNGNNDLLSTNQTTFFNNPNLTCISVEDIAYSITNWTLLDAHSGFSEDCFQATEIVSFTFPEQSPDEAIINDVANTINLDVVFGTDLTNLTPAIELLSPGATVSPESNQVNDFSIPVTYTVTAEDGTTTEDWVVSVGIAPNTEADILSFSFEEQTDSAVIDAVNQHVIIEVERGTNLAALSPTIEVSINATISPLSETVQNFSDTLEYIVLAQDQETQKNWKIIVTEAPNTETDILAFILEEQSYDALIDTTTHTVFVEVEPGYDIAALSPTMTLSEGATISPESGVAVDFSDTTVYYLVTAQDGIAQQEWAVSIQERPLGLSDLDFSIEVFPNPVQELLFIESEKEVTVALMTLSGKSLSEKKGKRLFFDLSSSIPGIYLLSVKDEETQIIRKVIRKESVR